MKPMMLVAVVAIVVVAVAAVLLLGGKSGGTTPAPSTGGGGGGGTPLVGNDSDAHGCKGSAGYSWCEAKQKCLRIWEEPCETGCVPDPNKACTLEYMPVCGNDGVTYGNRCAAGAVCAEIAHEGECATGSGAGDCACPTGYKKEGDVCNPECYHSNPPCLAPSVPCELSGIPESTCNSACIAADYASGSCKWSSEAQSGESLLIACIGEGSKHCTGGACNCYCSGSIGLANPASVYCEQQGGILSILTVANNGVEGEVGMCELEDGRTCEEWALFRSDGANCTDENGFPA